MEHIISFKEVSKRFGRQHVLSNVGFSVKENAIFGLVGPSGAGKTTILNILLGLVEPETGRVQYKGRSIHIRREAVLQRLGFCTQENSFYPRLTVAENLRFYGAMYNIPAVKLEKRINELLVLVDLMPAKHRRACKLSGGMKRRLDFAIALVHDPEILILDEPTTGLDIVITRKIWNLVKKVHKMGKTIIIASHMLSSLQEHCTSYGLLYNGHFYDHDYLKKYAKKHKLADLEKLFIHLFGGEL